MKTEKQQYPCRLQQLRALGKQVVPVLRDLVAVLHNHVGRGARSERKCVNRTSRGTPEAPAGLDHEVRLHRSRWRWFGWHGHADPQHAIARMQRRLTMLPASLDQCELRKTLGGGLRIDAGR